MDDPEYAAKYGKPYSNDKAEKVERLAKQSVDARFVAQSAGGYLEGHGGRSPQQSIVGGELGVFIYPVSWAEFRGGLELDHFNGIVLGDEVLGKDDVPGIAALNVGGRVHAPTRLAPFVGAGAMAGLSDRYIVTDRGTLDVDGDGEPDKQTDPFVAVYPELGVHFWLTGHSRSTLGARYLFTSEGRNEDMWLVGFTISGVID
jgi:hypothetical protein